MWATSLRTIAPQLVAELNRRLGEGTVTRVIIEGLSAGSWTARHLWLRSLTLEGVGTERRTRENMAHMG